MVGDRVDRLIAAVRVTCDQLRAELSNLSAALDDGAGDPIAGELTPDQSRALTIALGRVGEQGGELLQRDLARTMAREGVDVVDLSAEL